MAGATASVAFALEPRQDIVRSGPQVKGDAGAKLSRLSLLPRPASLSGDVVPGRKPA
jgi:hypothetical protein